MFRSLWIMTAHFYLERLIYFLVVCKLFAPTSMSKRCQPRSDWTCGIKLEVLDEMDKGLEVFRVEGKQATVLNHLGRTRVLNFFIVVNYDKMVKRKVGRTEVKMKDFSNWCCMCKLMVSGCPTCLFVLDVQVLIGVGLCSRRNCWTFCLDEREGKHRRKIWLLGPLCLVWLIWSEHTRRTFQRVQNQF